MVNTLSGSVCAYRKETVKPRFIRIDEKKYIFDPKSGVIEEATPETYVEDTYLTEK